jgi:hypothetical protein
MKRYVFAVGLIALLTSGCIANPWPDTGPAPSAPHVVLAVGDSLLSQIDSVIADTLTSKGYSNVTVIDAHINGSGLIGPVGDAPSALAWTKEQLDAYPQVDTVMVDWVGVCASCGKPGFPAYGSADFLSQWITNAKALIDYIKSTGRTVVWAKTPPLRFDVVVTNPLAPFPISSGSAAILSSIDESVLQPYTGVSGIDLWTALTDNTDHYQDWLFYDDGWHWVRYVDGVHLTPDGSTRASEWTVRGLAEVWRNYPPPTTTAPPTTSGPPSSLSTDTQTRVLEAGDPITADGT